jgi:beta-phosphoglucomutase
MLRAIIFDFNGIIVDDEPLHFLAFRQVFGREGIRLTREAYYKRYLAFDDRSCVKEILTAARRKASDADLQRLRKAKQRAYNRLLRTHLRLFPGIVPFVRECAARYPLAIASGALGSEIRSILKKFKLDPYFDVMVSADDVVHGKPHPESFLRAWRALNRIRPSGNKRILPGECLVIEDSLPGIEAAHVAGMKCVAVAHSYPLHQLRHADKCARSVKNLRLSQLESLFSHDQAPFGMG